MKQLKKLKIYNINYIKNLNIFEFFICKMFKNFIFVSSDYKEKLKKFEQNTNILMEIAKHFKFIIVEFLIKLYL